jgi:hypothetical protein
MPSELLLELPRNGTFEPNFKGTAFTHLKSLFFYGKFKHLSKGSFWLFEIEVAFDLPSVFNLDRLFDWLIHKDISKIDLLLSQVSFGSQSFTLQLEWKSLLSTRDIAKGNAFIGIGLGGAKSDGDGDFAVRPNLSNQGLYLENVVLEEE